MSDRRYISAFMIQLDQILTGGTAAPTLTASAEEGERLQLALELSCFNIAEESLVREGLLRHLIDRRHSLSRTERSARPSVQSRRPAVRRTLAVTTIALAAMTCLLAVASPRTMNAFANAVGEFFGKRVVAPSLDAMKDSLTVFHARYDEGRYWELKTTYGATGGDVTKGMKPYSRYYASFVPLARDARIPVLVPTDWPEGLPEILRFKQGWLNPDGSVWLEFCVGRTEFMLSQTPRMDRPASEWTFEMAGTVPAVVSAEDAVEFYQWGDVKVAWHPLSDDLRKHNFRWAVPSEPGGPTYGSLRWEKDGIGYVLDGQNMTLARAEVIWRSLEPVKK